jgi:hypothetical protein
MRVVIVAMYTHRPSKTCATLADVAGQGLRDRLSRQGEEALGRIAEELAANPVVTSAIAGAFEARERAVAAQEAAMGALGIPSAADIERLTRRVRSVSQRLEGIEDALDRLDERLMGLDAIGDRVPSAVQPPAGDGLERRVEELKGEIASLRQAVVSPAAVEVPRAQERLNVAEASAASEAKTKKRSGAAGRKSTRRSSAPRKRSSG